MAEKAQIRNVPDPVGKAPQQINWANIISPTAMRPQTAPGEAAQAMAGTVLQAGVKYNQGKRAADAASAQAQESAAMIGEITTVLTNADKALAAGNNPQAVQTAAFAQMSQVLSRSQHMRPSDQIDMLQSARQLVKDAVGLKTKVESGVMTIADGYGNMSTFFDVAAKNQNAYEDLVRAIIKERPEYGIALREQQILLSQTQEPAKRQEIQAHIGELIQGAKQAITLDHQLATQKLQRELNKPDATLSAQLRERGFVQLQNGVIDSYLNYSGPAFKAFIQQNRGKDPETVKVMFKEWLRQQLGSKAIRGTLIDVGKSADDLMSSLSTTIKIGEDMIDAYSQQNLTQFEIETLEAQAQLRVMKYVGEDGLVKAGLVRELAPIMNINYVMARRTAGAFEETQFASQLILGMTGSQELRTNLESTGTLSSQQQDAIIMAMKGYYNEGATSVQGLDLYNTLAYAAVLEPIVMVSGQDEGLKRNFATLRQNLMALLPKEARGDFDKYVSALQSMVRAPEEE